MASFYGCSFMYNKLPSELFDLIIMNFDTGITDGNPMVNGEIDSQYVRRSPVALSYGTTFTAPIEFDLTIGRNTPITAIDVNAISMWLIGSQSFLPFQIIQDDMIDVIMYTIFTSATLHYSGNLVYAMTLHGVCNSPFAFTEPKRVTITGTSFGDSYYNMNFYNQSVYTGYTYPNIEFTMNGSGGDLTIMNISDVGGAERKFMFTNLIAQEKIFVDNRNKILTSNLGMSRLGNFSKNWMRLLPGENDIIFSGSFKTLVFEYSFSKALGV